MSTTPPEPTAPEGFPDEDPRGEADRLMAEAADEAKWGSRGEAEIECARATALYAKATAVAMTEMLARVNTVALELHQLVERLSVPMVVDLTPDAEELRRVAEQWRKGGGGV